MSSQPLIEVTRGPLVESVHRGDIAVVDSRGRLVAQAGDPHRVAFLRSSAKPLQVVPLVERGAADQFGFAPDELAVMAGSHNGEPHHIAAVLRILDKIGLAAEALQCGVHEPFDREARQALSAAGRQASGLHNNCSGKHAAMLALAAHLGHPTHEYTLPDHPVQRLIRRSVAEAAGLDPGQVDVGVDGCGVPVFGMPLSAAALAFARLVDPPAIWPGERRRACQRVVEAMWAHPEMVAGRRRVCTEVLRTAGARLVAKSGAEGFYAAGAAPRAAVWEAGLGLALKIEDGNSARARDPVVVETLRQLGLLRPHDLDALAAYRGGPIPNRRGDPVGQVRTCFTLQRL